MDKVKHFLEVARRHHFWILCGLAALIGLVVLTMSSGRLAGETKARISEIDGKLSAVTGIPSDHPNATWEEGITALKTEARESVRRTWTDEFDKQKGEIFIWPAVLDKDFLEDIAKVEEGKKTDIEGRFLERYLNYVPQLAKALPKIVDAEVVQDAAAGGAVVAPAAKLDENGNPILEDRKVIWDQASQQAIFDTFTWYEAPSTTIVRQAQEELWVYESLCKVIAEVNKNAKGSHDAPITGIQDMSIAYSAHTGAAAGGMMSGFGGTTRGVLRVKGAALGAGGGDMMRAPAAASPEGAPAAAGTPPDPKTRCKGASAGSGLGRPGLGGGMPGADPAAAATTGNPDDIWKGFRYVDETDKPLATAADVDASALEFNLMPFRMRLTMSPKAIDDLLIECRNATLPIEVREIDLLEGAGGTSAPVGGGPMFGGGGGGMRRGPEGEFDGGGGGGMRPPMQMQNAGQPGAPQQKTIQIEVSGVVYLMKRPDPSKLGITPPEGGAPADGTVPPDGAAPADGTAPAAAAPMNPQAAETRRRWPIARFETFAEPRTLVSVWSANADRIFDRTRANRFLTGAARV